MSILPQEFLQSRSYQMSDYRVRDRELIHFIHHSNIILNHITIIICWLICNKFTRYNCITVFSFTDLILIDLGTVRTCYAFTFNSSARNSCKHASILYKFQVLNLLWKSCLTGVRSFHKLLEYYYDINISRYCLSQLCRR